MGLQFECLLMSVVIAVTLAQVKLEIKGNHAQAFFDDGQFCAENEGTWFPHPDSCEQY